MFLGESFRAEIAGKRFDSTVQAIVENHVGPVSKSLLTTSVLTLVRLFTTLKKISIKFSLISVRFVPYVRSIVLLQKHFPRKLFTALIADVWFQSEMNSHVHVESHSLIEGLGTVRAVVLLLVPEDVTHEIPSIFS